MKKSALLGMVMAMVIAVLATMFFSQQVCFADSSRITGDDKRQVENVLDVMSVNFGNRNFRVSELTNHELIAFGVSQAEGKTIQKINSDRYKISAEEIQTPVRQYFSRKIKNESCPEYKYYYLGNGVYNLHFGDAGLGDRYTIVSTLTKGDIVNVLANGVDPEAETGAVDDIAQATFRKVTENGVNRFVLVSVFHKKPIK